MPQNGPTFVAGGEVKKPDNLIALISQVERISSVEREGGILPEGYVTIKQKIDYFTSGFKIAFFSTLFLGIFSPLAIAVIMDKIPIFGNLERSLFDKAYILIFSLSISMGYAWLIGSSFKGCYIPNASKSLINQFLAGYTSATLFKAFLLFVIYHVMFFSISDQDVFELFSSFAHRLRVSETSLKILNLLYQFLLNLKSVLIESAWSIAGTSIACIVLIYGLIFINPKKKPDDDE